MTQIQKVELASWLVSGQHQPAGAMPGGLVDEEEEEEGKEEG